MNLYGLSGPYRFYGHPTQFGAQIAFRYQVSLSMAHVQIDIFFASFEGQMFVTPKLDFQVGVWLRYEYPNSGFHYIDFFGEPVLAPVDIDGYLKAAYGANYMEPSEKEDCDNCFKVRESPRFEYMRKPSIFLNGMTTSYAAMCDAYTCLLYTSDAADE